MVAAPLLASSCSRLPDARVAAQTAANTAAYTLIIRALACICHAYSRRSTSSAVHCASPARHVQGAVGAKHPLTNSFSLASLGHAGQTLLGWGST